MSADASYLRFPSIRGDLVAFVAEDDVWVVPATGGRAWRLTADDAPAAGTRLSPDGGRVAFTSRRSGPPEVHVVDVDGGGARRLTWFGDASTRVLGWVDDDHVLAVSATAAADRDMTWAWSVPVRGGRAERLPLGPISGYAQGPGGAVAVTTFGNRRGAASWKRYRGGTSGQLWLDRSGTGEFERFLTDVVGQHESPEWVGDRLAFLSDHEGWGNVYSVSRDAVDGSGLRRHTDHGDAYARALTGDGERLVYACRGRLMVLDDLAADSTPRELDVHVGGPRTGRRPALVDVPEALGEYAVDHTGRATVLEVRGTLHWLTHRDGPVRALGDAPGVRHRLPLVVPEPAAEPGGVVDHDHQLVLRVSDADGDDALEVGPSDSAVPPRRVAVGQVGRVLELAASPDGRLAAVATHDCRLLLVDLTPAGADAAPVVVVEGVKGDVTGVRFSPDSRWLAWSHPGPPPLRQIRVADLGDRPLAQPPESVEASPLRFVDTEPVFTADGRHLAFLSVRTFDPVYDAQVFDMSFLAAQRPYLLPLAVSTPSPFDPEVGGRPAARPDGGGAGADGPGGAEALPAPAGAAATGGGPDAGPGGRPPERMVVDTDGLVARAVPFPVAAGRYADLRATATGVLWREPPLAGELGEAGSGSAEQPGSPVVAFDLTTRRSTRLVDSVTRLEVSGDGRRLVVVDADGLRVLPAATKADDDDPDASVRVDLARVRVLLDPAAMWRQMFEENRRLMRDHFWAADMAGVDWDEAVDRYRPLLDRIATRDDLSEVLWEVNGELAASHAYESPPDRAVDRGPKLGHLGADLGPTPDGEWRVERVVPGEPSVREARSPLLAPGVGVVAGEVLLAVDGRAVDPRLGPAPLLDSTAGKPVELTVRGVDGSVRRAVVVPLADEHPLRYHDWVAGRRAATRALSEGRVGYLHVPDMMAGGWAQLHRDLHTEVARDALVVDLRGNGGGHLSELVLEKLARRLQARSVVRHGAEETWPSDAPRGPLLALTNQWAGSDGDIGTAMFRALGLGPVVGTRTWGGVIGIDGRYTLVDGTAVTQPRYAFWTRSEGWGIENYGVEPDVEVHHPPQAWAAGEDPQLETGVRLLLEALRTWTFVPEPDAATGPDRAAPALPPRPS